MRRAAVLLAAVALGAVVVLVALPGREGAMREDARARPPAARTPPMPLRPRDDPRVTRPAPPRRAAATPPIRWRESRALGTHGAGRLVRGVRLPHEGRDFTTWDPIRRRSPNRAWRRWAADDTIRILLRVARAHRARRRNAPRLLVGDLSRPRGGDFGPRYGAPGHLSHTNGLDVDVYLPRRDGRRRPAARAGQVRTRLAQDLVDRFVAAGASKVFVGPSSGLRGPPAIVQPWPNHDDHLHVRFAGTR